MTQIQSFDFLTSIKALEIPQDQQSKTDFFSDEDAAAWAKEAEAAGLDPSNDEATMNSPDSELSDEADDVLPEQLSLLEEDSLLAEMTTGLVADNSVGLKMGDELWTFQVLEHGESEVTAESIMDFEDLNTLEDSSYEPPSPVEVEEVQPSPTEIIEANAAEDFELESVEDETSTSSLIDGGSSENDIAENEEFTAYNFSAKDLSNGNNQDSNKSSSSSANEQLESIIKNAASGELGDQAEFESHEEEMAFEEFSFMEDFEQIQSETSSFEHASNDNQDSSVNAVKGSAAASLNSAQKSVAKMPASLTAMQARAEALAKQESFTLKGSEFGGDMDVRMRSTRRGLDLTLMPQLSAQANRLTGSLKTIKTMLNDRGIEANEVRMETEQVLDPLEVQAKRFQDTALFSNVAGSNDNRIEPVLATKRQLHSFEQQTNDGDLA